MAEYIEHLKSGLSEIERGIEQAKARLENSETADKAEALAELSQLRIRHDDLVKRIGEAERKGGDDWSSLRTGFQEEVDGIRDTVGKWLTRLG